MKQALMAALALTALGAGAQSMGARESFLKHQAYAEMQRVSGQVDLLASNQEELSDRIRRTEAMRNEIENLKAEVAALKAANAELRGRIPAMRDEIRAEIVKELSKKIGDIQAKMAPPPPQPAQRTQAQTAPSAYTGPYREYEVKPNDSLYMIAAAFKTTVARIKEMNGLKSDTLRIGQKLKLPL